jgi:hypothetical protein
MPETEKALPAKPASNPWRDLGRSLVLVGSGSVSLLAWMLPDSKPGALFGRLSYLQTGLAVFLTACFVSSAVILVARDSNRRQRSFRVAAIWLGIVTVLFLCEAAAWVLPHEHLADNPWYVFLGSGVVDGGGDDVRFIRPPHINWQGRSRGDLAIIADRSDPYAQTVLYQTDSEGFRNGREIRSANVVFLGDSFTEAGNMPEKQTFPHNVARALKVVGRNLGRSGYSPSEELSILKTHGLRCRPEIIVWQISETNDLNDEVAFHNWIATGRRPGPPLTPFPRSEAWKKRSPSRQLFRLLRQSIPWPYSGTFHDATGQSHDILFSHPPDVNHSPVGHAGWPLMEAALREGAREVLSSNTKLVLLLVPKKMRVLGHYVEFNAEVRRNLDPQWDLPREETLAWHLDRLCKELDVPFIDATPLLKQRAADGQLVYLPFDSHLSSNGHTVVSEMIVDVLRREL